MAEPSPVSLPWHDQASTTVVTGNPSASILPQQPVRTDDGARALGGSSCLRGRSPVRIHCPGGPFQKIAGLEMVVDQLLEAALSHVIAHAKLLDEHLPLFRRGDPDRLGQAGFDAWPGCVQYEKLLRVLKSESSLALPPVGDGVGGSQDERLRGRDHDETAAGQL